MKSHTALDIRCTKSRKFMSHDECTKEMFLVKFMVAFKAASEKKKSQSSGCVRKVEGKNSHKCCKEKFIKF